MITKTTLVAQNPLIMRSHRLMEAFAKSDDERDFYLDRLEGFLIYIDLDKTQEELDELVKELKSNPERYCPIPKLTFYEIKKVMEGFVNEKVYDIDTKEKLLDIIQSKEARENFLEFIYDHHTELEKWQQYYQERFRVRIIEWLRQNEFDFVFEEDLELTKAMVERLKMNLFMTKVGKDIAAQRKLLIAKAKTYYSNEALNPRPKRGRPPKQVVKVETEPQFSQDIYTAIPKTVKPFLFSPDYHGASAIFTFSGKFASEADLLAHRRQHFTGGANFDLQNLQQKLSALRSISGGWSPENKELDGGAVAVEEVERKLVPNKVKGERKKETVKKEVKSTPSKAIAKKAVSKPVVVPAKAKPTKAKSVKTAKAIKKAVPAPKISKSVPVKKLAIKKKAVKAKPKVAVKKVAAKPLPSKAPLKALLKKKAATVAPKAKVKPVAVKSVAVKKAPAKSRLRPLVKKSVKAAPAKKEKPRAKVKSSGLRHLRPVKKR